MSRRLQVLIASRSRTALEALHASLARAGTLACSTRLLVNGSTNPLPGGQPAPDALVLHVDSGGLADLAAMAESSAEGRPPVIVVGPPGNTDAVRLALRSGARDFLADPVDPAELVAALERLLSEAPRAGGQNARAEVTVVLGAAGGVGTSFVACNLAHAFATEANAPTLLMDLDINNAPLASFLDLVPERGLVPAIAEAEFLDEHALQGYVTRHRSGLHLMGAPSRSVAFAKDLDPSRFAALLHVVRAQYRHVVVDAAHVLDDINLTALGVAKTVVLVLQQSVVQLKQAARLVRVLATDAGIPDDRILVVVNRHVKRSTVGLDDVRRTLGRSRLVALPNQYQSVLSSIDGGVPALELDRSSAAARGIVDLQKEILGAPRTERASLLRRALPMLSGD